MSETKQDPVMRGPVGLCGYDRVILSVPHIVALPDGTTLFAPAGTVLTSVAPEHGEQEGGTATNDKPVTVEP